MLEDLQVWIEDSEDFMQYYKRYPKERFNGQENVQYLWTNSGLDDGFTGVSAPAS